ncbi:hypothetical protein AB0K40_12770 [Nonomuraea bangladeshensis]|uniref:Uncharacterized protein n=1 Tax=Nonomuraea bangladeshensis TaxID=404385 RepID=A0ABV3H1F5_9ACTN
MTWSPSNNPEGRTTVQSRPLPAGVLHESLDVATAVDIYAGLCNVDVYRTLTDERGWSPDRVERWWAEALARELLHRGSDRFAAR